MFCGANSSWSVYPRSNRSDFWPRRSFLLAREFLLARSRRCAIEYDVEDVAVTYFGSMVPLKH